MGDHRSVRSSLLVLEFDNHCGINSKKNLNLKNLGTVMGSGYNCITDETSATEGQDAGMWNKVSQNINYMDCDASREGRVCNILFRSKYEQCLDKLGLWETDQ